MAQGRREAPHELYVLKFGSSVLETEADFRTAAQEVYRHVRLGEKIVAVVSALAGETDQLLDQAMAVGGHAPPPLVARLARLGELRSAALMTLALCRMGVRACALDPHEMGLEAEGEALDSNLVDVDPQSVLDRFDDYDVVVVPGFTAGHKSFGVVTLGRGGTDLSAVFFASRLGSKRVRLLKDVDGVYAEDPAKNPLAERYGQIGYEGAAQASAGLIQPKAIHAAEADGIVVEVAAIGHQDATVIAAVAALKEVPLRFQPLRVALLGCGSVGAGVLSYLEQRPDLFDLNPVLVRHPQRHEDEWETRFSAEAQEALAGEPDLVIELIGGADYPAEIMCSALRSGAHVVTANKAALARHYDALHACAEAGRASLRYSAAVGGGTPVLEMIHRLRDGGSVGQIEGVMNGTANFLLSRLGEGWDLATALARAQALGFAEDDPSADVDGHDAADKLSILVREAFGVALPPERILKQSLRDLAPGAAEEALARGEVLKQVGRCRLGTDGRVEAEVRIEALALAHPLAGACNEENRFVLRDAGGTDHAVYGKGAGRWPTAAAVFADVMDLQRALATVPAEPVRLRA